MIESTRTSIGSDTDSISVSTDDFRAFLLFLLPEGNIRVAAPMQAWQIISIKTFEGSTNHTDFQGICVGLAIVCAVLLQDRCYNKKLCAFGCFLLISRHLLQSICNLPCFGA